LTAGPPTRRSAARGAASRAPARGQAGDHVIVDDETHALPPDALARRLASWLRDDLGVTSVKVGCEEGACGACTVLLDGEPVPSCLVHCGRAAGRRVETAATAGTAPPGDALVAALVAGGGLQCGFCTPGITCAATALLRRGASTQGQVRDALAGHLCRCTGYAAIVQAVLVAGKAT